MKQSDVDVLKGCRGKKFRRKIGIRCRTFRRIVKHVHVLLMERGRRDPLSRRGKKSRALTLEEKLVLTFVYLRHYPTCDELGAMFGISEGYANTLYRQPLNILVKVLRLPGKKALLNGEREAIILDVTEQPLERPTKKQRQFYSGKKKRHTINAHLIICATTLQILLVICGKGRTHDFKLLKRRKLKILAKLNWKDVYCL